MALNKNNLWKICAVGSLIPMSAFMINWKTQVSLTRQPYYSQMETLIREYTPLQKHVGPPITIGWVCRGFQSKTEVRDNSVKLEIPLHGKKDKAVVVAEALKDEANEWNVTRMTVTLKRAKKSWLFYSKNDSESANSEQIFNSVRQES